jgi:hypothetical protein
MLAGSNSRADPILKSPPVLILAPWQDDSSGHNCRCLIRSLSAGWQIIIPMIQFRSNILLSKSIDSQQMVIPKVNAFYSNNLQLAAMEKQR